MAKVGSHVHIEAGPDGRQTSALHRLSVRKRGLVLLD
jgi:hypothetical protein